MDWSWWKRYGAEAKASFRGQLISHVVSTPARQYARIVDIGTVKNSGAAALLIAHQVLGAKRILMLGYDCQHTGGRTHHHGDHPKGLGNAGSVAKWPAYFGDAAARLRDIEVINCSRSTALESFPRAALETCL